jgi:hypothetical protein
MCVKNLYNDDDDDDNNNNNNTVFQMIKILVAWANFVETAGIYVYITMHKVYISLNTTKFYFVYLNHMFRLG